jgi:hypothetical protein
LNTDDRHLRRLIRLSRTWRVARRPSHKSLNKVDFWRRVFQAVTRTWNRCHYQGRTCAVLR